MTNDTDLPFLNANKTEHIYKNVWGGDDLHIGLYRPKTLSPVEANRKTTERMLKLLPRIKKSTKILVVQSGFGGAARFIAETYGCKVWCINDDKAQNKFNEARIAELELEKKVTVDEGFVEYMPYDPDYFDFIVAQDTFSLTGRKMQAFRALHRVLKPEGRLIISALMRSEECLDDDFEAKIQTLPVEELITEEQYEAYGRRGFLQQIYALDLSGQLEIHYDKVLKDLEQNGDELAKQATKKFVETRKKHYQTYLDLAKRECLNWGILMFQKLNS